MMERERIETVERDQDDEVIVFEIDDADVLDTSLATMQSSKS